MKSVHPCVFFVALSMFWGASCASENQGGDFVLPDVPTDTDPGDEEPDGGGGHTDSGEETSGTGGDAQVPANRLVGRWGGLVNMEVVFTDLPLVGALESLLRYFYLVDIYETEEGDLRTRERLCSLVTKVDATGIVSGRSDVEPGFVEFDGLLERGLHLDSAAPGTPFTSDVVYQVRGADVCDDRVDPLPPAGSAKQNEAIPCDGDCDGGACDQDRDGHPGITSRLTGAGGMIDCDIYYAHRWWTQWDGVVVDLDTLSGGFSKIGTEQAVFAASNVMCAANTPVRAGSCSPRHHFKLVRLPDDADCAEVMALTDCDETGDRCDQNEVQPLDPKPVDSISCD